MSYARNLARLAATGITTVATNQDLRDLVIYDGTYPQMAQSKGAATVGDHNGGLWRWQADSVAVDDGLNVLLPTGQSASVPGRWIRQADQVSILVVETTQDLRDFAHDSHVMAQTIGAKSVGDGGGGFWRWQADSLDVDNFGVVLLPSGQNIAEPGRWLRQLDGSDVEAVWWGLVDGGVVDASPALQDAIDYIESSIGTSIPRVGGTNLVLPQGTFLVNTPLLVSKGGVSLTGVPGRGSKMLCPGSFLQIGPDNYWGEDLWGCGVYNLFIQCTNTSSTTTFGIKLLRTLKTDIFNVELWGFYNPIDLVKAGQPIISGCTIWQTDRTTPAQCAINIRGIDESAHNGDHAPMSYGVHITDCELYGNGAVGDETGSGILVQGVDGLYMAQTHFAEMEVAISFLAKGTPDNPKISSVLVSNCYFDGPSGTTDAGRHIAIYGVMRKTITLADGSTQPSILEYIAFSNCYFRAGGLADYCFTFNLDAVDGWTSDFPARAVAPLIFTGCHFDRPNVTAFYVPDVSEISPGTIDITGCHFREWNRSEGSNSYAIAAHAEQINITGCSFDNPALANPSLAPANVVLITQKTRGAVISGNDFSKTHVRPDGYPIYIDGTNVSQSTSISGNALPGVGKCDSYTVKETVSAATAIKLQLRAVGVNEGGALDAMIVATGPAGKTASAHYKGGYTRGSSGVVELSSGTYKLTADYSWKSDPLLPDTIIPTFEKDGTDLISYFTGVSGAAWNVVANLTFTEVP